VIGLAYKISQTGPLVSHLLFADDLILCTEASTAQAKVLNKCFGAALLRRVCLGELGMGVWLSFGWIIGLAVVFCAIFLWTLLWWMITCLFRIFGFLTIGIQLFCMPACLNIVQKILSIPIGLYSTNTDK
jgi:hypothetical protein